MSKLPQQNLLGILQYYLTKNCTFCSHITGVCSSCCHHAASSTLPWSGCYNVIKLQSYLHLLSYLVISMIAIHFCMASPTLTSQDFIVFRSDWPPWWQSSPSTRSVLLLCFCHLLPVKFRILFKVNLLTYKALREKQLVYLHLMLAASLPSRSLNKYSSLSVPGVKAITCAKVTEPWER